MHPGHRSNLCGFCKKPLPNDIASHCSSECIDAHRKRKVADWLESIPAIMREHDLSKIPKMVQFQIVRDWQFDDDRGLILYGSTGTGKTRACYALAQRLVSEGADVRFLRGVTFQNEVVDRTKPGGSGDFTDWFDDLCNVDYVLLDDIDKTRFSPRVESELYNLIDVRTSNELPIVLSANSTGPAMQRRMSPETGPAICRRIAEFCEPVNFDA